MLRYRINKDGSDDPLPSVELSDSMVFPHGRLALQEANTWDSFYRQRGRGTLLRTFLNADLTRHGLLKLY